MLKMSADWMPDGMVHTTYQFYKRKPHKVIGSCVVNSDGPAVGYTPDEHFMVIWSVQIRPDFQGKGYCQEMLSEVLERLKFNGVRTVCLSVLMNNSNAKHIYSKMGFKPVPTNNRGSDVVVMTMDL